MYQEYAKLDYTRLRRRLGLFLSWLADVIEIRPQYPSQSHTAEKGTKTTGLFFSTTAIKFYEKKVKLADDQQWVI